MKVRVPDEVARVVKSAFTAGKTVCGCTNWATFAAMYRPIGQARDQRAISRFLQRAQQEASAEEPAKV